jgi:hypothetical protein
VNPQQNGVDQDLSGEEDGLSVAYLATGHLLSDSVQAFHPNGDSMHQQSRTTSGSTVPCYAVQIGEVRLAAHYDPISRLCFSLVSSATLCNQVSCKASQPMPVLIVSHSFRGGRGRSGGNPVVRRRRISQVPSLEQSSTMTRSRAMLSGSGAARTCEMQR